MLIKFEPGLVSSIISNHSVVYCYPHKVIKMHTNHEYRAELQDKGLKGEIYFLQTYKSPYFIKLLNVIDGQLKGVVLENGGAMVGNYVRPYKRHKTQKFYNWLDELDNELQRLKIAHGDLSPSNILYDGENYKLIDFDSAVEADHPDFTVKFAKDREAIANIKSIV